MRWCVDTFSRVSLSMVKMKCCTLSRSVHMFYIGVGSFFFHLHSVSSGYIGSWTVGTDVKLRFFRCFLDFKRPEYNDTFFSFCSTHSSYQCRNNIVLNVNFMTIFGRGDKETHNKKSWSEVFSSVGIELRGELMRKKQRIEEYLNHLKCSGQLT